MPIAMGRMIAPLLALGCITPIVALLWMASDGAANLLSLPHFSLAETILNSLLIVLATGMLTLIIGVYTAWIVSQYEFPGRRIFSWALLLPLAMPAYLLAIVYGHWLDVAGPLQAALRDATGLAVGAYPFPPIRSLGGVIGVLSLALYPYVYLTARHAFAEQLRLQCDAAWLCGTPPAHWLRRIALPAARPAIMLGVSLVMMEALADFGVASLYGVPTFTTGIYRIWYGLNDPSSAAALALLLLLFVLAVIVLERASRHHQARAGHDAQAVAGIRFQRGRMVRVGYSVACLIPILLGFLLPALQILWWALGQWDSWQDPLHWQAVRYSLLIAAMTTLCAAVMALLFAYRLRRGAGLLKRAFYRLATFGYAIPGAVIAVAIFIPLLQLDKTLANWLEAWSGSRPPLIITGSVAAIVIACSIRFLAVAMANIESALLQISQSYDDAAKLLGLRDIAIFRRLHWPYLRLATLAGGFMVFSDTLKELPATLMLRPFDVTTLSIRTYELASDGRLVEAAVPAMLMMLIGLAAVAILIRLQAPGRETHTVIMPLRAGLAV